MILLLAGKNIYISNRKFIILGSFHGESDALFGFYQECFNTLYVFGTERKHIIFIILLVQIHIIMIMYLILSYLKFNYCLKF